MSLLNKLANLELPNRGATSDEECPICAKRFTLAEFAPHVYECVQVRNTRRLPPYASAAKSEKHKNLPFFANLTF